MVHRDIAIIGAGAAGLFAGIWAGRTLGSQPSRIVLLDGAKKLGAKILVAGGGRCNVTHHVVDELQYAGSSRNAIKKVLRRFDVEQTVAFFRERGVELKREETGKLFPTTDDGRTILDALLGATRHAKAAIAHPWRVAGVRRDGDGFVITRDTSPAFAGDAGYIGVDPDYEVSAANEVHASRLILATGGKSLPRSGSDGLGHQIAQSLGHSITQRVFPSLVPLTIDPSHWLTKLSGLTLPATASVRTASGKVLKTFTNSTLITHFGLSGPCILDISRYYTDAYHDDNTVQFVLNFLPQSSPQSLDAQLIEASRGPSNKLTVKRYLTEAGLPERLAEAVCMQATLAPGALLRDLSRDQRRAIVDLSTQLRVPITGDRGYTYAEVTAGGVPLAEIDAGTMQSRLCPNLYFCGEILDVDGRIGGFNFQWAWASGYAAGISSAAAQHAVI
ncbi:MAG TPA: NAD(P)/FAD-dependent oxidoreductase [Phycisphaerales bacterium]|nr:NAD(P)/FAD-dependent oxidoreductase [Phycisphaerales bacterium]